MFGALMLLLVDDSLLWILPLSLFSVIVKVLTYWSYETVPVSVVHTCKASQPLFNVFAAYAIYRSKFSLATYLSLLPIVLGVVLASVSEMRINVRYLLFSGDASTHHVTKHVILCLCFLVGPCWRRCCVRSLCLTPWGLPKHVRQVLASKSHGCGQYQCAFTCCILLL